jgi:hypothetical protein
VHFPQSPPEPSRAPTLTRQSETWAALGDNPCDDMAVCWRAPEHAMFLLTLFARPPVGQGWNYNPCAGFAAGPDPHRQGVKVQPAARPGSRGGLFVGSRPLDMVRVFRSLRLRSYP